MEKRSFGIVFGALALGACTPPAAVRTGSTLPLRRVVVYRNGIGYFERRGEVHEHAVQFRVLQREVGDFLATLAVMERGGSSVRAAAFPLPAQEADGVEPNPDAARTVRLALDGERHDLTVGYTVETPIWRPSYRLVFTDSGAQLRKPGGSCKTSPARTGPMSDCHWSREHPCRSERNWLAP